MMKRAVAIVLPSVIGMMISMTSGRAWAEGLVVPKKQKAGGDEAAAAGPAPIDWLNYNVRPLTLSRGMVGIHGDLAVDISANKWGKPMWLIPGLYYGVSDQFTIGITGNPRAEFFPTEGGFCLSSSGYCPKVVIPNNVSFDLLFSFNRTATMEVAFHGGIDLLGIDPFVARGRAGFLMKFSINNEFAIMADPSIGSGLNKRGAPFYNEQFLSVPIRVGYQFHPQVNAGLITGVNSGFSGAFEGFGDRFLVPVGLGALAALNEHLDAAVNITFAAVAGNIAPNTSHIDYRSVALTVNYRM